jgi:hypothetical protein
MEEMPDHFLNAIGYRPTLDMKVKPTEKKLKLVGRISVWVSTIDWIKLKVLNDRNLRYSRRISHRERRLFRILFRTYRG